MYFIILRCVLLFPATSQPERCWILLFDSLISAFPTVAELMANTGTEGSVANVLFLSQVKDWGSTGI